MLVKLILIGKLKDRSWESHCQEYLRRLGAYGKVEYVELPDSDPISEAKLIQRELERDKGAEIVVLGEEGREYTVVSINTDDEELNAFLFSLGCYSGEPITVIKKRRSVSVIAVKDGRYCIDRNLAEDIEIA